MKTSTQPRFDPTEPPQTPVRPSDPHVLPPPEPAPAQGQKIVPLNASPAKRKLNFGALKPTASAVNKPGELIVPDPTGAIAEEAAAFLEAESMEKAAKGAKEIARANLIIAARPYHFQQNAGRREAESSVTAIVPEIAAQPATAAGPAVAGRAAGAARITFKDAYPKLDAAGLQAVTQVVGQEMADGMFTQKFELSIKSDNIPDHLMQTVIDRMNELAVELQLPNVVESREYFAPVPAWHQARYSLLSPEINLRLEGAIDAQKGFCVVAVGPARGRK